MYGINKDLNIHFIGIGGIGMSGIAEILIHLGYKVSGSDINKGPVVVELENKGAKIFIGHTEKNVENAQLVVFSSAIDETNPEIIFARKNKIPIIRRAEMLAELMRLKFGIAVAGSHGKTTTTSFLATIMNELNYDPTHIIGGIVRNLGGNAHKGEGEYLIAEADESDGSFLYLNPIISIVTNIDNDHLDFYKSQENLTKSFLEFANKVPFYGRVFLNAHDPRIGENISKLKRPYFTFGLEGQKSWTDDIDFKAQSISMSNTGTKFDVVTKQGEQTFEISLPGNHNVLNALGAIATANHLGAHLKDIAKVLPNFKGVGRRLELLKKTETSIVLDDYAHHPTEIKATIAAVKNQFNNKKLVSIFEPHRYTRTQNFWDDFAKCFDGVDDLYILPIYAASEKAIPYIDSEVLVKSINDHGVSATYISNYQEMTPIFKKYLDNDTIILVMGAGPISSKSRGILESEF